MKTLRFISFFAFAALMSSCATYLYQWKPASGDIAWVEGREVTRTEQNGVVLVASYEFEDQHNIVLDVEVKNRTEASLLVDPSNFSYIPFDPKNDTLRSVINASYPAFYRALNPEEKIQQATLDIQRAKRRLVAASILNGVLLVATVASDVQSSNRRDKSWTQRANSQYAHAQAYNFIIQKQIADVNLQRVRTEQLQHERANWQELALRKTTLPPNESVRGLVFLPKDERTSSLWLTYASAADSTQMQLKFLQEKIKGN